MKRTLLKSILTIIICTGFYSESKAQLFAEFTWGVGNPYCTGFSQNFFDQTTGTSIPNSWQWDFGDGTTSTLQNPDHAFGTAGTFSVRLIVSAVDSTGSFVDTIFHDITILAGPVATFNVTNAPCGANGSIDATISGGTPPYSYIWSTGSSLQDINFAPVGTYDITVYDSYGCNSTSNATVGNVGAYPASFSGSVTNSSNGAAINGGTVLFIQKNTGAVRATAIISAGTYSVGSLSPIGQYIIKVIPDSMLNPFGIPTYLGLTNLWNQATTIIVACDSVYVVDLELMDLTPLTGTSTVQGLIVVDTTGTAQFKTGAAGDPIPGVDVSLEQVPGGIIAHTQTGDGTNGTTLGVFSFENVPVSATPYKVLVDIPGSAQVQEQTVTVSSEGSNITNVNYAWTDAGVVIAGTTSTKEWNQMGRTEAYPIPFNNQLTIAYSVKEVADVKIELTDVLGKSTVLLNQSQVISGNYLFKYGVDEVELSSGVYFLKVLVGESTEVIRVVKQ